jgi:hypothetical protein
MSGPELRAVYSVASAPGRWRFEVRVTRPGAYRLEVRVIQWRGLSETQNDPAVSGCNAFEHTKRGDGSLAERLEGEVMAQRESTPEHYARFYDPCSCHLWCYRSPGCVASEYQAKVPEDPVKRCRLFSRVNGSRADAGGRAKAWHVPAASLANATLRWQQQVTLSRSMNFVDIDVPRAVDLLHGFPVSLEARGAAPAARDTLP